MLSVFFAKKIWLGFREEGRAVTDRGMFSYSFYFECYEVSTTTFGGAPTLLSTLDFCKFEYSLLWWLLSLTHWCWLWSFEAEGGDSLDAVLCLEALEAVHGGGGEAVAQGAPVHSAHAGQVVSLVGVHTSGQGGAQTRTLSGLSHVARHCSRSSHRL